MIDYKIGDKVRIVRERPCEWNWANEMDKWLGKVMTIDGMENGYYCMAEDHGECKGQLHDGWNWDDCMIAGLSNPPEKGSE